MIRGYTVQSLKKRLNRLGTIDHGLHVAFDKLHDVLEKRYAAHAEAVKQAVADRYASIRNAQEEITQLEKLVG